VIFGLEFPPVSHAIEWPDLFLSGPFAVNKVVLLMWLSVAIVFGVFSIAGRKRALVPTGVQNIAESTVDFIQEGIILQTMGHEGLKWTPFMLTLFTFIFTCNIWGIIPVAQMPVNARMALPLFMALLVWLLFVFEGFRHQGLRYLTNVMFPPGVPKALYILVSPIEFVSVFLVRPLSHSVRLFANALAGHLILISFAVITAALFTLQAVAVILPFSFFLLVALTGFELLVAFLQAYIFTILAAVYLGSSIHPDH
jgi:F-type H+-transporting ATPase subunit a